MIIRPLFLNVNTTRLAIHWVIIAATNLQCTILHKLYYLRCRDFLKLVTGHLDTKHNWSKKWDQTTGTTKKATSCSVLRIKGCIPLGWSASGSEITRIVVDQMNRWIHSGQGPRIILRIFCFQKMFCLDNLVSSTPVKVWVPVVAL